MKNESKIENLNRRQFLRITFAVCSTTAGAWNISCVSTNKMIKIDNRYKLGIWLESYKDDLYFICHQIEMGQGIIHSYALLFCEEFDLSPKELKFKFAPVHSDYKNPLLHLQATGGSTSIKGSYALLQKAGALSRKILVKTAAREWKVEEKDCYTKNGYVYQKNAKKRPLSYPELISLSDGVSVYDHFTPKKDNFRYIGKKSARIDNVNKLKDPSFGIDSAPLGALNCSVLHKPRGCDEYNINNSADIEKLFGVRGVLKFDFGIAIVAEKFWQVKNAMDLLDITWKRETHDSTLRINQISSNETPSSDSQQIESSKSLGQTSHRCTYSVPYLAHACMEPINGCALLTHESCELWIPTQAPILAQAVTAQITGLEFEQIRVNCAFCGGGFGRRLYQDFVEEVVRVAQQFPGIPIQMIWTREEDMRNDFYRPESTAQLEGLVSSSGELISWSHTNFTAPFSADVFKRFSHGIFPEWLGHTLRNKLGHGIGHLMSGIFAKEGANKIPYKCENFDYQWKETEAELPLGFWRSVGHSINGFFKESFIDELSYFTKLNPIDFRLKNIPEEDFRHKTVLVKLSQHKLWSSRNNNKGVGVAIHESYDTVVGQLVKVSEKNNNIEIDYIYIVVDCGHIVDPDGVKSQMEGGVVFGLSAALWGEITVQNHDVEQSNFHDYQCMRMDTCPDIDVDILDSISEKVGGCGEAGVPPIAAAVANAIYHLNGKRLRSLPLLKHY